MLKFNFKTIQKKILSDSTTPVELYLKLRDVFPNTLLLEFSSCYYYNNNKKFNSPQENSSIICINPISELILEQDVLKISYPNNVTKHIFINDKFNVNNIIQNYFENFQNKCEFSNDFINYYIGLYGYISYDSIQYFEKIKFYVPIKKFHDLPKIRLGFYKNLVIFNHSYNELYIVEHQFQNTEEKTYIDQLVKLIEKRNFHFFPFSTVDYITSNLTDNEYIRMVSKGINACLRGNVFQIVLSRQFQQKFKGDEFNVYRALRFINPSPYLFYFDYGYYKIFGSSPESQLVIYNNIAYINPIAGTIKRSNESNNDQLSQNLSKDPKENAEHVMLVDLARNDLSKNSSNVKVDFLKKIQKFSHVLHMVSQVSGEIDKNISIIKIFTDTFPSGTLSGAPKYKAMELIDKIENQNRGVYGGAIGLFGINNSFLNTAIIIRSFISKNNTLFFQAGAGIVSNSKERKELEEVDNKLMALFKSIDLAKNI
ncbi:anthranilate synthase component I family protein [Blattabacterium cuenoti]|uniref:anthranilate synthase component I family protein n=1 Tax=Blattabacterium cuenoti TaxID=1653831 RepID=UPI00163CFFA7|nr:anthranilate synthase component I family protein [Blattabacterium cuenoti]